MLENIVIIDNSSYTKGGTAQVAISSAIELARRGYKVTYIAADGQDGRTLINAGISVINLKQYELKENPNRVQAAVNGIWNTEVVKRINDILSAFNKETTIVHIHGYLHRFSPSIFKACKESRIKTILTLHDYFILCPCGGFYDYSHKKTCNLKPMSIRCITCNCDKRNYFQKIWRVLRQFFVNKYVRYNKNLNLIYISDFSFSKMKKYIGDNHKTYYVRNPYDLGKNCLYTAENNSDYVYLGRLSSEKGVDLFCEAFSQLKKSGKLKGNAIVVGDGDQREKLAKEYPLLNFIGWKNHNEIENVISKTRALIFPSKWYEGAPLTPIEFMSHGVPCISSNACSAVEYIDDHKTGLIFETENIESLKQQLLYADSDDNWSIVSSELRKTFCRDNYSLESHVTNLLKVYGKVLGEMEEAYV